MINYIKVRGLNGHLNLDAELNEDLTVLTGKNGCGKTTLLKLIWYSISPNIERAFFEVDFDSFEVDTTDFNVKLEKQPNRHARYYCKREMDEETCTIDVNSFEDEPSSLFSRQFKNGILHGRSDFAIRLDDINNAIRDLSTSSLYFPTFRRIEEREIHDRRYEAAYPMRKIAADLENYSSSISVDNHRFIAAVSTRDIVNLITEKYAVMSEQAMNQQANLLEELIDIIQVAKNVKNDIAMDAVGGAVDDPLSQLTSAINNYENKRGEIFESYHQLEKMVSAFISEKVVKVTPSIGFGEMKNAIAAERLSAGEKQMLGFLTYNAFSAGSPILIDEPELSLHVDWQRQLVPSLLAQGTTNQFIMATHSPFIYSRYPEKEVLVGGDRGE